ncbi:hypothetical protein SLEP1_g9370 [Rubroshorea leprosula]|uniref:Pectinesterase inhibitor domain-containing protein n=1 Tax=Rubroshorea leprosula TaxID=152421 RepID=A0AAV5I4P4_9ROSI|nr:hypothetical protein SLEP1_g9370 [Rubroshorea leprosula]
MIAGKSIIGSFSILFIAGTVCIGLTGRDAQDVFDGSDIALHTTSKTRVASAKDYLKAAIHAILDEVELFLNKSGSIFGDKVSNPIVKMAKGDCDDLLQFAIGELQASFSMVGDESMHTQEQRAAEIKNWLSAVISYHESCIDQIPQLELQKRISDGLLNATQLTSNELGIVSGLSSILNLFNLHLNIGELTPPRKLSDEQKSDGGRKFPHWVPNTDMKLLGSQNHGLVTPNAVVAKDGSGQFKTIMDAVNAYPKNYQGRYVIYVKAGVYDETVLIPKSMVNVFMYGVVRRRRSSPEKDPLLAVTLPPILPHLVTALGDGFMVKSMGFSNTAGWMGTRTRSMSKPTVNSTGTVSSLGLLISYSETVHHHPELSDYCEEALGQPEESCYCSWTSIRERSHRFGYPELPYSPRPSSVPCKIQDSHVLGKAMEEILQDFDHGIYTLGDLIQPEGWMPWAGSFALNTLWYAEFADRGPGAATNGRVKWKGYQGVIDRATAEKFTAGPFLQGDIWLGTIGIPCFLGLSTS